MKSTQYIRIAWITPFKDLSELKRPKSWALERGKCVFTPSWPGQRSWDGTRFFALHPVPAMSQNHFKLAVTCAALLLVAVSAANPPVVGSFDDPLQWCPPLNGSSAVPTNVNKLRPAVRSPFYGLIPFPCF